MADYCKDDGIIFHCIFGTSKQFYTAERKFQSSIDSNNYSKVQEQKTQESCRVAGGISRRSQTDMADVAVFGIPALR